MPDGDSVRLHIVVSIDWKDDDYDTGMTVDEWNALTPEARSEIRNQAWQVACQNDNGGIWTDTEGATND
jgi:hypothetical protein